MGLLVVSFVKEGPVTPMETVVYGLGLVGLLVALVVGLRRQVLRNEFSRQLILMLFIAATLVMVPRVMALFLPIDVVWIFAENSFALAGICLMGGLTLIRWVAWVGVIMLVGGIVLMFFPDHALRIFGVASASSIIFAAVMSHLAPGG